MKQGDQTEWSASQVGQPDLLVTSGPRIRPVPAVSRSIAILRLLGKTRTPLGVNAIAQALGLVPSTC